MSENYPTEINSLPDSCGYELIKSIPIAVELDDDTEGCYVASTGQLGQILRGFGDSPVGAKDNLTEIIIEHAGILAQDKKDGRLLENRTRDCDQKLRMYLRKTG